MNLSELAEPRSDDDAPFRDLFSEGDFRFQMRMRRASVSDFFKRSPQVGTILAERRHWLQQDPDTYTAFLPEADESVQEGFRVLLGAGVLLNDLVGLDSPSPKEMLLGLGCCLEPDVVFLIPDAKGEFRMVAACVCFPSSWSVGEKIGRPLAEIHGPVPTLNDQLGSSISRFLSRMAPGVAWCRENWGLTATADLNYHPARRLPRLSGSANLDTISLRLERQALVALPISGGVLFAIRVEVFPLVDVISDVSTRVELRRAVETMPDAIAEYKGILAARKRLVELLA